MNIERIYKIEEHFVSQDEVSSMRETLRRLNVTLAGKIEIQ